MARYIELDALEAEIERLENKLYYEPENFKDVGAKMALDSLKSFLDTLEVKEVDLELIIGWFDHIAQIANDRKTLNGDIMDVWAAFDEIKCLAKNSSEFIQRHYKAQKGEEV